MPRKHHRFPDEDPGYIVQPTDLDDFDESEYRSNRYYRARIDQREAARQVATCLHPLCDAKVAKHLSPRMVLCLGHALDLWSAMEDARTSLPAMSEHEMRRELRQRQAEQKRAEAAKSAAIEPGWIYYIRVDERIKIGYSADVRRRMRAYPPHSELLAVHPGTPTLEREIHREFRGHLAQGREWFRPDAPLMERIEQVVEQFGPPPKSFVYKFREGSTQRIKPRPQGRARKVG